MEGNGSVRTVACSDRHANISAVALIVSTGLVISHKRMIDFIYA
jgi:hypothetical protein